MLHKIQTTLVIAAISILLNACATTGSDSSTSNMSIYEVHKEGRIHIFYDRKEFQSFIKVGESAFRLTRIGAGPKGENPGLRSNQKRQKTPRKGCRYQSI